MFRGSKSIEANRQARRAPAPPAAGPGGYGITRTNDRPPDHSRLFAEARRVLQLSQAELARRLGTSPLVIRALETGRHDELPPWPEVVRVVTALLSTLGLDPRPVLHALSQQVSQHPGPQGAPSSTPRSTGTGASPRRTPRSMMASALAQGGSAIGRLRAAPARIGRSLGAPMAPARAMAAAVRRSVPRASTLAFVPSRRRRLRRALLGLGVPALLALGATQAALVSNAASSLPEPVGRVISRVVEHVRIQLAPVRDGMRWIEVDDPRSRRGDKLQTARR